MGLDLLIKEETIQSMCSLSLRHLACASVEEILADYVRMSLEQYKYNLNGDSRSYNKTVPRQIALEAELRRRDGDQRTSTSCAVRSSEHAGALERCPGGEIRSRPSRPAGRSKRLPPPVTTPSLPMRDRACLRWIEASTSRTDESEVSAGNACERRDC